MNINCNLHELSYQKNSIGLWTSIYSRNIENIFFWFYIWYIIQIILSTAIFFPLSTSDRLEHGNFAVLLHILHVTTCKYKYIKQHLQLILDLFKTCQKSEDTIFMLSSCLLAFNTSFQNISVISWPLILLVEETIICSQILML
jgi:hypothetical protein